MKDIIFNFCKYYFFDTYCKKVKSMILYKKYKNERCIIKDMLKNTKKFESLKSIALNNGYTELQVNTALEYIEKYNLVVEIKNNSLFDILNKETDEYIDKDISLDMVIERGYDCLRSIIESYLRYNCYRDIDLINNLLNKLNAMYENTQYVIKESNELKYLALSI